MGTKAEVLFSIHQSCLKNCIKCTKQQGDEVVYLTDVLKTQSLIPVTGSGFFPTPSSIGGLG